MEVKTIVVGDLETNCYLAIVDNECIIIDPGAESEKIIKVITKNNLVPVGYLITHDHFDHTEGLEEIVDKYQLNKEIISKLFEFETLFTPGHTPESKCYYFLKENVLFSGDTLFKETIGRMDLEGGNHRAMFKSIAYLKKLPDNTIVYPGHGEKTSIESEKMHNIWLQ